MPAESPAKGTKLKQIKVLCTNYGNAGHRYLWASSSSVPLQLGWGISSWIHGVSFCLHWDPLWHKKPSNSSDISPGLGLSLRDGNISKTFIFCWEWNPVLPFVWQRCEVATKQMSCLECWFNPVSSLMWTMSILFFLYFNTMFLIFPNETYLEAFIPFIFIFVCALNSC